MKDNTSSIKLPMLAYLLSVLLLFGIGITVYVGLIWLGRGYNQSANSATQSGSELSYVSQLDGRRVATEEEVAPRVVGAMIDNHPGAWPQSGLESAAVIYEVPVEGNLTRLLAMFSTSSTPSKAGPIRSTRPYFLDWLREYGDALYLHSGGSPVALDQIKSQKIFDANEFYWGKYYWRDSARLAPHNLFTKGENWQKIWADYGNKHTDQEWTGWTFTSMNSSTTNTAYTDSFYLQSLTINYSPDYAVRWRWRSDINQYERWVNGQLFGTADQSVITADNVIVQLVSATVVDELGRLEIVTTGSGEARVMRDGLMWRGQWRKQNASERTRFYDQKGNEILLAPGTTWVQIVPLGTEIKIEG